MKKLVIVYVVLIVAVILLFIARGGGNVLSFLPFGKDEATAEVGASKVKLMVAKSEADRIKGLSNRKTLGEDEGMLFVFDKIAKHSFWMKDTTLPLDIIWINKDTVVHVVENAKPNSLDFLTPTAEANYVIEVNAGAADKLKIQKGTKVSLKGV